MKKREMTIGYLHSSPVSLSECPYRYPHLEEVVQASGSVLGLYHQIP